MRKIRNVFAFLFYCSALFVNAQDEDKPVDVEGSADHPMLSRMPNYYISEYEKNYDRVEMMGADGNFFYPKGMKTYIFYAFDETTGQKIPSNYQILKNYEGALKKIGGKLIYTNNDYLLVFTLKKNGHTSWVMVEAGGNYIYLNIVEEEAMEQEITASDLYKKLSEDGSVALYINFETGKSQIKSESQAIIDQIVEMLKENETLKISIEGHTDNVGAPASNKTLSLNRAKAVVSAISAEGIEATRLSSVGWGQEKPIGDNKTEEGRASNRRVEIVKK